MPTSTTIRRTIFFMDPPRENVDAEDLAEACGNRTHRSRVPPAPNGFEVRAGHQPRGASADGPSIAEHARCPRSLSSAPAGPRPGCGSGAASSSPAAAGEPESGRIAGGGGLKRPRLGRRGWFVDHGVGQGLELTRTAPELSVPRLPTIPFRLPLTR